MMSRRGTIAPMSAEIPPGPPREEIYVSTDVEANGPIPAVHSMLSLGSAAFRANGELLGTWTANLETLPGATEDDRTMEFWAKHPDAWRACRENPESPQRAILRYLDWLDGLPGVPVFVAYPAGFDFSWVHWYLYRFGGRSPFFHSALDMKTFAMALLRRKYRHSGKSTWPRHWFSQNLVHNHIALDDALEQGYEFMAMLAATRDLAGGTDSD